MSGDARLVAVTDSAEGKHFLTDGFSSSVFSVQTFSGTEHTVRHLQENPADLLLLDTDDDTERAVDALTALRARWTREELPVIVLLESNDCETIVRLLEAGATDFELKPLKIHSLNLRVGSILQLREKVARLIDIERQRVLSDSLFRASATAASALGEMIDQLERLMSDPTLPPKKVQEGLETVLSLTEQSVAVIDRIQQIAHMNTVPYAARKHLLDELTTLQC